MGNQVCVCVCVFEIDLLLKIHSHGDQPPSILVMAMCCSTERKLIYTLNTTFAPLPLSLVKQHTPKRPTVPRHWRFARSDEALLKDTPHWAHVDQSLRVDY